MKRNTKHFGRSNTKIFKLKRNQQEHEFTKAGGENWITKNVWEVGGTQTLQTRGIQQF